MTLFDVLALAAGTTLIRFLHRLRRKLVGEDRYFSFSDFIVEERHVESRGFFYMAIPPFLGGMLIALVPDTDAVTATVAGFLAAFLAVWPVFSFPYLLLEVHLLPYWGKLRFLYVIFLGSSATLAYLGFVVERRLAPLTDVFTESGVWKAFVNDLAANAVYDVVKGVVVAALIAGGVYIGRERRRIGAAVEREREVEGDG
jgi:hypothetical protein